MSEHKLLRLRSVQETYPYSRSQIYCNVKNGTFVQPVALGPRAVAWLAHEVVAIADALVHGASSNELRALVRELHEARGACYSRGRYNPNDNPALVSERGRFWERVRAGEELAPRDRRRKPRPEVGGGK